MALSVTSNTSLEILKNSYVGRRFIDKHSGSEYHGLEYDVIDVKISPKGRIMLHVIYENGEKSGRILDKCSEDLALLI